MSNKDEILKTPPLNEINDICDDDCTYKGLGKVADSLDDISETLVPLKLYQNMGNNTDGAMSQHATTVELENRANKVYFDTTDAEIGQVLTVVDNEIEMGFVWSNPPAGGGDLPSGGTDGQVLRKVGDVDYNVAWKDDYVPSGGTTGQVLKKASNDSYDVEWGVYSTRYNYLESIDKDETNEEITITDNEGNETTFPYGGSGGTSYPLTKTSDTSVLIPPNNTVWITGTPTSVNVALDTPLTDYESEYRVTFTSGSTMALTVTPPTGYTIVYPDGVPTFTSGKLYELSFMVIDPYTISCLYTSVVGGVAPVMNSIGGRIFYIDPDDNGATYKFYDTNGNELTTQTVEGLATAVSYTVQGTPTKDKFYILATDSNNDNHAVLKSKVQWGAYNKTVGITTDGIGQGKPNTEVALANSECFKDSTSGTQATGSNTIWTWLKDKRDNNLNGYNDWFIPSVAELKKLHDSGIEKDYIINTLGYDCQYLWSSVEYNSSSAYYVSWSSGVSNYYGKYFDLDDYRFIVWGCVATRAI